MILLDEVDKSVWAKAMSSRAKTRDPVFTASVCKYLRRALDPGSRPGRQREPGGYDREEGRGDSEEGRGDSEEGRDDRVVNFGLT